MKTQIQFNLAKEKGLTPIVETIIGRQINHTPIVESFFEDDYFQYINIIDYGDENAEIFCGDFGDFCLTLKSVYDPETYWNKRTEYEKWKEGKND